MQSGRLLLTFFVGGCLLVLLMLFSVAWGSVSIALDVVVEALLSPFRPAVEAGPMTTIVLDLRLPRTALAVFVGAGLGIVGALLQTITRNDLADPFLFGLSSGAAAGAVSVITVFGDQLGIWTLPLASFVGGMLAAITVLLLVRRMGTQGPEKLILAGLAVSFLFAAMTNYLVFAGDQRAAHSVLFWSLGGLGRARWDNLLLGFIGLAIVAGFALLNHRKLDAILGGEHTAESLGVSVKRLQVQVFLVTACATAIFVALTGVIGFIGLMVPHIARWLSGPVHQTVILLSALIGAILLTSGDLIARIVLAPQELPVGIVTSSFGAAFVFAMLMRRGRFD